jgi:hypothetical protein
MELGENILNRFENLSVSNIRIIDDLYLESEMKLTSKEDKYNCFLLLTSENNLCQKTYDETYLKAFIENSTHFQMYRKKETKEIIGFNLLKLKKKHKMDIILTCAVPNDKKYGTMIAFGAHRFAVRNKVKKILVAPRTPGLRATFVRHGFISCFGTEGIDEVLEKEIRVSVLKAGKTNVTRHIRRPGPHHPHRNAENLIFQSNTISNSKTLRRNKRSGKYTLRHNRAEE